MDYCLVLGTTLDPKDNAHKTRVLLKLCSTVLFRDLYDAIDILKTKVVGNEGSTNQPSGKISMFLLHYV